MRGSAAPEGKPAVSSGFVFDNHAVRVQRWRGTDIPSRGYILAVSCPFALVHKPSRTAWCRFGGSSTTYLFPACV
eukprot:scaffold2529_cov122-Isochrysis_galbana.AAC.21